jgi:hypothetical protein
MKFVHSNTSMHSSAVSILSSVISVYVNIFIIGLCKTEQHIKHPVFGTNVYFYIALACATEHMLDIPTLSLIFMF